MKGKVFGLLLLCLLPLCALGEEVSVALTSYEEHEALHEKLLAYHWVLGEESVYYSFGSEREEAGLREVSNETDYQLFTGLTREKADGMIRRLSGWKSWWVRLKINIPKGTQAVVENFRFLRPTEKIWIKMVPEVMEHAYGADYEGLGLERGEYHLWVLARADTDLKTALEEAQPVCDVIWYPGTPRVRSERAAVDASALRERSFDQPVRVQALTARKMTDEEALEETADTRSFWDDSDFDLEPLDLRKEDLWEITAGITKKIGYPLVAYRWLGSGVGGGWRRPMESPVIYDTYMHMRPEDRTRVATFYVRFGEQDSLGAAMDELLGKDVGFEYATEYSGDMEDYYTAGPRHQVKVDMSKVEIVNER